MSHEAAVTFLATVAADPRLQAELDAHLEGAPDGVQAFVEFAAQRGHHLSASDVAAALRDSSELTDAQLGRVAGGFNPQPEPPATNLQDVASRYKSKLSSSFSRRGF